MKKHLFMALATIPLPGKAGSHEVRSRAKSSVRMDA